MPNSQNVSNNKGSSHTSGRAAVKAKRLAEPKTATARRKLPTKQDGCATSPKRHKKSPRYGHVLPVGRFSAYEGRPQAKARPANGVIARSTSHTVYSKDGVGDASVPNNTSKNAPSVTKQFNPSTARNGPHLNIGLDSTRSYPNARRNNQHSTRNDPSLTREVPSSNRCDYSATLFDPCERQSNYIPSYCSPYKASTVRHVDSKNTLTSGFNPIKSACRDIRDQMVGNNMARDCETRNNNQQTDPSSEPDNGNTRKKTSYQNPSHETSRIQSRKSSRIQSTVSFDKQEERKSNPASRQTSKTGQGLYSEQTAEGSGFGSYDNVSNPVIYERDMGSKQYNQTGGLFGKLVGKKEAIQTGPEACTVNLINRAIAPGICPQYCKPSLSALSSKRDHYIESRNTEGTTVFIRPPCTIPNSDKTYFPTQFASKQKQDKEVQSRISKPNENYVSKASQKRLADQRPTTPPCAQFEKQQPSYEHLKCNKNTTQFRNQQAPFPQFGHYQPPFGVMCSPNRVKSPQKFKTFTSGTRTRNEFDCKQTRSLFNPDCTKSTYGNPEPPTVQFGNKVPSLYRQPHLLSPTKKVNLQQICKKCSPGKRRRTEFDCKQTKSLSHPDCSTRQVPNGSARLKNVHTARFPNMNTVACKKENTNTGKKQFQRNCGNTQSVCNQTNQSLRSCGNLQSEYHKTKYPQSECQTGCGGLTYTKSSECRSPLIYGINTRSLETEHITRPHSARYKEKPEPRDRLNEFPNEGNRFKQTKSKVRYDWMTKKDNDMVDDPSCPAGRFGHVDIDNTRPDSLADYLYDTENFTGDRSTCRDQLTGRSPPRNGPYKPPGNFQYRYSSAGPCVTNMTRKQHVLHDCNHNLQKHDCKNSRDKGNKVFLEGVGHRRHEMEEASVRYHTTYKEETLKRCFPKKIPPSHSLKQTTMRPISIPKTADTEFGRYVNDVLHPNWENDKTCKRNLKFIVRDPSHFQLRPEWNKHWIFNQQKNIPPQKRITANGGTSSGAKDRFLSSRI